MPRARSSRDLGSFREMRHRGEGGIIYCLRRSDVDNLAATLARLSVKAMPYHAGLSSQQRTETQDAFTAEQCDVVVATVAFGLYKSK